jgi:hypothetical protein
MNARSAAAYALARRFASASVCADRSHVARAALLASLTLVAACVYAAASCATDGIGAEVTDGDGAAEGIGVAVAGDARDGPGVALVGGVDGGADVAVEAGVAAPGVALAGVALVGGVDGGADVAVEAGVAAPDVPIASATECPGEGDNQPATASVRKTTTVIRTTA